MPSKEIEQPSPLNKLEEGLIKAQNGELTMPEFLQLFLSENVAIASASEVMADWSGLQPLLFDKEGVHMISCFTGLSRMEDFGDRASYALVVKGRDILERILPGMGLVINPGADVGFDLSPEGITRMASDGLINRRRDA